MRFLIDECISPTTVHMLRQLGHDVLDVKELRSAGNGVRNWIGRRVQGRKNTTRLPTLNPEEPVILFNFVEWYFQEGISEGGRLFHT